MNYKFSIKIAAVLAAFSGTAIGPTSLLPSQWLATSSAQPPIVSPQQAQPKANSNMLVPIAPAPTRQGNPMPWKVDRSKYQTAIQASPASHPNFIQSAPARKKTALLPPVVRQSGGNQGTIDESKVQPAAAQLAAPVRGQLTKGFSSAGIPLYTPSQSTAARQVQVARNTAPQGSATRNVVGSGLQAAPAPPVISPNSEMIIGNSGDSMLNDQPSTSPAAIANDMVGSSETVYSDGGNVIAEGSGCSTCDTVGAAGCESCGGCNCGPDGCYNADDIASKAGLYGSVGEARFYSHMEALLIDRYEGDITLTRGSELTNFDSAAGWRLTIGQRFDAINGRELSYMGTGPINEAANSTADSRAVRTAFQISDGITDVLTRSDFLPFGFEEVGTNVAGNFAITGVSNATSHFQYKETYFHSLEFNRVRWGWDVFKSFIGLRYIHVNDQYQLTSTNNDILTAADEVLGIADPENRGFNASGVFRKLTMNNLIGPHIGAEWFYDVGYRWSLSVGAKGGIYGNFHEVDTRMFHGVANADGSFTQRQRILDQSDTGGAFSTSLEGNIVAHYQIAPRGRFRVGYNILYLDELATVSDNVRIDRFTLASTGVGSSTDDHYMSFHGLSVGLELFR